MSDGYGVQPTGYVRKPLAVILAEIEAQLITEFGPEVIQAPQSPLGQLNGLFANLVAQQDELNEAVYHTRDPDQAEGVNLDILARIRQIVRNNMTDAELARAITNEGVARIDLADILAAIRSVEGVTYAAVYTNETNMVDENGMDPGSIAIAAMGGDDADIADAIRANVAPGTIFYGNQYVTTNKDGLCRSVAIIRPIVVPVELTINVRVRRDSNGCPPPSVVAIGNAFLDDWAGNNANGKDITFYNVRALVESRWPNVEVLSISTSRDGGAITDGSIGFIEISDIDEVTVNIQ